MLPIRRLLPGWTNLNLVYRNYSDQPHLAYKNSIIDWMQGTVGKANGCFPVCVPEVYQTDGLRGFYRKMSASYAGISETVIHLLFMKILSKNYWNIRLLLQWKMKKSL